MTHGNAIAFTVQIVIKTGRLVPHFFVGDFLERDDLILKTLIPSDPGQVGDGEQIFRVEDLLHRHVDERNESVMKFGGIPGRVHAGNIIHPASPA